MDKESLANYAANFAKKVAFKKVVGPEPIIPIPFNKIKSWIKTA